MPRRQGQELSYGTTNDTAGILVGLPRKLLTTRQAAERHGVTPQAIRTLEYRGRVLKVAVIEGTSVYDETHLDAHFGA